jgi:hypothetical protein
VRIAVRFAPGSLTLNCYEMALHRLQQGGDYPPRGLVSHYCIGTDGDLRISEVWNSREDFEESGGRLVAALAALGVDAGEPDVLDVHRIIRS